MCFTAQVIQKGRVWDHTGTGPYRRGIQDGEGTDWVGPRTRQEDHTGGPTRRTRPKDKMTTQKDQT